jgi:hypothetical protein
MKGRRLGEKAFTRRTPIEGAPGRLRKEAYGVLASCLGSSGGVSEGGEDDESLGLARGGGRALLRRLGSLGRSGIAVEDAWRMRT